VIAPEGRAPAMEPQLYAVFAVFSGLLGLCVGSFLNVVICRLPEDQSLGGRSHCTVCGKELLSRDLIPILSQLLLRSRCRFCGVQFSYRYMAVEVITGLIFLGLFFYCGPERPVLLVALWVCFASLIALFVIDWQTTLIPHPLWITILVAGVGYDIYGLATGAHEMTVLFPITTAGGQFAVALPRSVIGALVGLVGLRLFVLLADLAFRKETMGFGDIYLTGAAGAFLGPGLDLVLYIVLAAFAGALIGGTWMLLHRKEREDTVIPFGPFLAVSLAVMILWGDCITGAVRGYLFPPPPI